MSSLSPLAPVRHASLGSDDDDNDDADSRRTAGGADDEEDDATGNGGALPGEDGPDEPVQSPVPRTAAEEEDDDAALQGSHVRVLVRVRPLLEHERAASHSSSMLQLGRGGAEASASRSGVVSKQLSVQSGADVHRFTFDGVLAPHASQVDVYDAGRVERMLQALLKGYHGTIFAYGQTGSGKTHTMDGISYSTKQVGSVAQGDDASSASSGGGIKVKTVRVLKEPSAHESGLSLRCINELFALIAARQASPPSEEARHTHYTVRCSFVQIYMESVFDLLADAAPQYVPRGGSAANEAASAKAASSGAAGLRIRWNAQKNFYVENLYVFECKSAKDARAYFLNGMKKRLVASHRMNASSSRTHSIFTLYVDQTSTLSAKTVSAKLSLVDLAGSERAALTGAAGEVLNQSIGINKSLFVLRKVIKALSKLSSGAGDGKQAAALAHVPYRDSALTRLLQHSLGGNSVTLMVACLSPSDAYLDENLSTLNYAGLAKRIANRATVNEDPQTALIRRLRAEIRMLRNMLAHANSLLQLGGQQRVGEGTTAGRAGGTLLAPPSGSSSARGGGGLPRLLAAGSSSGDSSLAEKLVDSVSMIKELMGDANDLRSLYEETAGQVESLEYANATLNQENDELRDRVHFLETVIVDGQGDDILKSPTGGDNTPGGSGGGVHVVDDEAESSQTQKDLLFEMQGLRAENQRLKNLLIATDVSRRSSGGSSGQQSTRGSGGAKLLQRHNNLSPISAAGTVAAPVSPPSSSRSHTPSGLQQVGAAYRAAPVAQSALSGGGRKARVQSGQRNRPAPPQQQYQQPPQPQQYQLNHATPQQQYYPPPPQQQPYHPPQPQQQQQPVYAQYPSQPSFAAQQAQSREWERQRQAELFAAAGAGGAGTARGGDQRQPPPVYAQQLHQNRPNGGAPTQAWSQPYPSAAPAHSNGAGSPMPYGLPMGSPSAAGSGATATPTPRGGGVGGLSTQAVSLQLGAPSWAQLQPASGPSLSHAAAANPAIAAFMQKFNAQAAGGGGAKPQQRPY